MSETTYVVTVDWDETARPGLPTLIGPFGSLQEAQDWAGLNVPNGHAEVRPLAYPYQRTRVTTP